MSGLFITMEGIDGCGKSTQIDMLATELSRRKLEVVVTREPGGTRLGEAVRGLLTSDVSLNIVPAAELCLIVGARAQHVAEFIRPVLKLGKTVICDRYTDSTVAFQGYGRGLNLELINRMNELATGGLEPDLTLVFDLTPSIARERRSARPVGGLLGAFDDEQVDFHVKVRQAYLRMARNDPKRFRIIEAAAPASEINARVLEVVLPLVED